VSDLRPETAIEVQEFWLRGFNKKADFRDSGQPERRRTANPRTREPWPKSQPWFRHDAGYVYCRDAEK
jgi:hypothetical protein